MNRLRDSDELLRVMMACQMFARELVNSGRWQPDPEAVRLCEAMGFKITVKPAPLPKVTMQEGDER